MLPEVNCYVPLDNREVTSSNLKYFACDSKKATVLDGPWSVIHEKARKVRENAIVSLRKCNDDDDDDVLCLVWYLPCTL